MTPWEFVVVALAATRLWRLIGRDTLTEPVRDRVWGRVAYWLECPWCSGAWVGFGTVALWYVGVPWWVFEMLAVAMLVAVIGLASSTLAD